MHEGFLGKGGVALAGMLCIGMTITGSICVEPHLPFGDAGICFPSPSQWHIAPAVGRGINTLLILGMAAWLIILNHRRNFMPTPSLAYASAFLMICSANVQSNLYLTTSTLLGAANLYCISMLMSQRGQRNSSTAIFLIMSLLSWGSMCQYAFLFFIPIYACCAVMIKIFRWKEWCAMLAGVLSPYIIMMGFGIVDPSCMHIPAINNIWMSNAPMAADVIYVVIAAVTALWALLLGLRNALSLISANTATRAFNNIITLPGIAVLILMIIDFGNIHAYFTTLALLASCQIGYLYALSRQRKPSPLPLAILFVIYIALFFIAL